MREGKAREAAAVGGDIRIGRQRFTWKQRQYQRATRLKEGDVIVAVAALLPAEYFTVKAARGGEVGNAEGDVVEVLVHCKIPG